MNQLLSLLEESVSIAISGHTKPDGDCIGSCMALYHYIRMVWPEKNVKVFLENVPQNFHYISDLERINTRYEIDNYDLFVSLDSGDLERLGKAVGLFDKAKITINIDHHISNTQFAKYNHVEPKSSATCEVLFYLFDDHNISYNTAVALYTGIIHDTGVLKYSNTTRKTLEAVAKLIEIGIPFTRIIDESFYQKTYIQNQLLGRCLLESIMIMDGKCVFSVVNRKMLDFHHAVLEDLDGVIEQLRITKGVEVALLIYEMESFVYKVSMRSNDIVDVSKIAIYFGGGGHIRAAGCTVKGSIQDVMNNLTAHIEAQL